MKSAIQALYPLWKTLSMETENNAMMINVVRQECCFWQMLFSWRSVQHLCFCCWLWFPHWETGWIPQKQQETKSVPFQFTVWNVLGSLRVCDHPGSWMKIVCTYQPLHNLLSFVYFIYAVAMLCWLILIVMWYLSHYFSFQIVLW